MRGLSDLLGCKPRTTDVSPWLWGAALTGRSEHSPRTIQLKHRPQSYGVHPRAYARGVLWYGVNPPLGPITRRMESRCFRSSLNFLRLRIDSSSQKRSFSSQGQGLRIKSPKSPSIWISGILVRPDCLTAQRAIFFHRAPRLSIFFLSSLGTI